MRLIQSVFCTRRSLALLGTVATSLALTGCYVVPTNSYPVHVPGPVQVAPVVVPVTFAVRLYPSNAAAAGHGVVHAVVTNDLNGRGNFNATVSGEVFAGEATRRAGSSRDGVANGAGSRGSYLACQYTMNSATQGTGACRLSDGAQFTMHIGH